MAGCATAFIGAPKAQAESAKSQLAKMQTEIALLTHQKPGLAEVRVFLSGECRKTARSLAEPKQTAFCQCGSTVTLKLWMASKQMPPILDDYLSAPSDSKLQNLAKYQGPELYKPFCTEAVGA